jgi:FMN phosphatase YigB (HAD superfamily)
VSRPLVVSDCDEVLLHMVAPFRGWLGEQHGVDFVMSNDFANAMRWRETGEAVGTAEMIRLLNLFFDSEMHRQQPIAGAVQGIAALAEQADVVILTNLGDHRQEARARQLREIGIDARVFTNQGPKGPALRAILDEYKPDRAIFIDDLPQHHGSVAETTPHVTRLHLCGEPLLAPHIACAHKSGHAHARIDAWEQALPWLLQRLQGNDDD